ncbi:tetratricopeptide repeat protein [Halomonas sp. H10-59]|uniref:Tetratricopeptide repeat protein n=1 Tax=Halomonas sp. H10-59 TaxID=2950874 RepID=A0AAU7KWP8_9GAMM|nr:tetratricopeptide repeat protein [Halomonas sp. DP1Y21-3]MBY6109240.1 tetratricopeptide repeat protein [Halomonas sp. DP1Y21-3]
MVSAPALAMALMAGLLAAPESIAQTPQGTPQGTPPTTATEAKGYAPEGSCASCHEAETQAWQDSDHAWALRDATPDNVLGDFDDASFEDGEVKARFHRRGDTFLATLEGPQDPAETFEIRHTFGVRPLQQYLVEQPGGRLQSLTIAWDSRPANEGGQRWFSLYPGQAFTPDDPLHWRGRYQNWNAMCADCHSTNLEKHYDLESDSFATTWHEQSVGCQSCHGPAQDHLGWAARWQADEDAPASSPASAGDMGLALDLADMDAPEMVEQCARCHSRRQMLGAGPVHGAPLTDAALPSLLGEGMYHADGQIQGEVYVYGSFTQSRMYQQGVGCVDCHDPHTSEVKIEGNGLCLQCHNPAPPPRFPTMQRNNYDSPEHHHHTPGSEGAQCVSCHMPETTYMVVDPRRDHSFRVPRPDLAEATGSPDACTGCHQDLSPADAAAQIREWFGDDSRSASRSHYGVALQSARLGRPEAPDYLKALIEDDDTPDIVRATAVGELTPFAGDALPTLEQALQDESPLVRAAAAPVFAQAPEGARVELLLPLIDDERLAVRDEAVKALAGTSLMVMPQERRAAFLEARRDYERRLEQNADLPGNRLNLAVLLARTGREDEAEQQYRAALAMDPYFLPARANLVTQLSAEGRQQDARALLKDGIALDGMPTPDRGHLAYLLALSLAEDGGMQEEGGMEEALSWLEKAAEWRPDHARTHYNRGLMLDRLGRKDEALAALEQGRRQAPGDPDLLYALVYVNATSGRIPQALSALAELRRLRPDDPRLGQLERQLRGNQ